MVAERRQHRRSEIVTAIESLELLTEEPIETLVSQLRRIVPEFRPQGQVAVQERRAA